MNEVKLTFILILVTFSIINIYNQQTKEHFYIAALAAFPKLVKAITSFFLNFGDLFMVLVDAIINFALNIVDLVLVLAESLQWIGKVPGWFMLVIQNIVNIFFDCLTLLILYLNPITLVRSIIKLFIFVCKMFFLMFADFILHLFRMASEKILNAFRGGMWGIPHEPYHHIKHDPNTGFLDSRDIGGYYHHHKHPNQIGGKDNKGTNWKEDYNIYHKYRSLRCYKSMTANGYLNVIAMIICPPLGVFMSFGLMGLPKIIICALLTLCYYVPGLIYGVLLTSNLGLGLQLKITDCGGDIGGLTVKGCENRKTEGLCRSAILPDKRGKDGATIPACDWVPDSNEEYGGKCNDVIYQDDTYNAVVNGTYDPNNEDHKFESNYSDVGTITGRDTKIGKEIRDSF